MMGDHQASQFKELSVNLSTQLSQPRSASS